MDATLADAPPAVGCHVRRRVLDTLAATVAGFRTPGIDVTLAYVRDRLDGGEATLLDRTGTRRSLEGAVLANATAANTLDIDDGHRAVKGHPAAVVVPAALAAAEAADATVGEFLDAVFVGYELGVRAGLAIHATDGVYTGTGSWGGVGAAAAVGRLRGLDRSVFADALSVAEYHGPRTPIMRGVERPGMTKDGVGWGAYSGTAAALLAKRGFTGSGTVFDETDVTVLADLGERYQVTRGYLKPYPCCRWAHPGLDAVLALRAEHDLAPDHVETIRVFTFEEATHLQTRHPETVEEAEYSYPYPVAVAMARGEFTTAALGEAMRTDLTVRRLADAVELAVDPDLDAAFPASCLARAEIETGAETVASDEAVQPRGARERPLDPDAFERKLRTLFEPTLDGADVEAFEAAVEDPGVSVEKLLTKLHG